MRATEARAYPCACGCGTEIVNATTGRNRIWVDKNHRQKAERDAIKAAAAAAYVPPPTPMETFDQTGPAPAFCGLCPLQSKRGNHPCTHRRLASRWMNEPASEARIHGACPWGRPLQGDAT